MEKALKVKELRGLSPEELGEKLDQLKKQLMQYRFQKKTGKLEQQSVIHNVKQSIARILTLLNEQKQAEVKKS